MIKVVMDNRQPTKTMTWILVLWALPVIGILLYIFFGQNTRKERLISERSLSQLTKRSMFEYIEQKDLRLPESHRPLMLLFKNQSMALPFKDNDVALYTSGYDFFPALLISTSTSTSLRTTNSATSSPMPSSTERSTAWRCGSSTTTWDAGK